MVLVLTGVEVGVGVEVEVGVKLAVQGVPRPLAQEVLVAVGGTGVAVATGDEGVELLPQETKKSIPPADKMNIAIALKFFIAPPG